MSLPSSKFTTFIHLSVDNLDRINNICKFSSDFVWYQSENFITDQDGCLSSRDRTKYSRPRTALRDSVERIGLYERWLTIYLSECLGELVKYNILVEQFVVETMFVIILHLEAYTKWQLPVTHVLLHLTQLKKINQSFSQSVK